MNNTRRTRNTTQTTQTPQTPQTTSCPSRPRQILKDLEEIRTIIKRLSARQTVQRVSALTKRFVFLAKRVLKTLSQACWKHGGRVTGAVVKILTTVLGVLLRVASRGVTFAVFVREHPELMALVGTAIYYAKQAWPNVAPPNNSNWRGFKV